MEALFGVILIILGIVALSFIAKAKGTFPEGSELKSISQSFLWVVLFLFLFSFWHTIREAFSLKESFGDAAEFPEYLFILITYILIFLLSRRLSDIAKKFGVTK